MTEARNDRTHDTQQADKTTSERVRDGYDHARHSAADAYAQGRGKASDAARRAAESLEANPLGVLAGGLAVGALVGALIPRSAREKQMLAPVGQRLSESARAAVQAAREAGYNELDQRGLTPDAAKDQARGLFQGLAKAASSAGSAAAKSATAKTED